MWYLLLQIFFLMILAALAGAMLAYWWMKNRYEDVTESYEDLLDRSLRDDGPPAATRQEVEALFSALEARIDAMPPAVTREELDSGLSGVGAQIASLPQPDLSPVVSHLEGVSARLSDEGGALDPLKARLEGIEAAIGQLRNTGLDSLESRLLRIEEGINLLMSAEPPAMPEIPEVDLGPVHSALAAVQLAVENIDIPMTDLDPIRQDFGQMESRLAEFAEGLDAQRKADNESMTIRLQTLSSSLASLRVPDVDGLRERLSKLENVITSLADRKTDLGPVTEMLREIDSQMRSPSSDMRVLHTKLADLEGGTAAVHAKLVMLENSVSGIDRGQIDLSPVQNRLSAMESAIASLRLELQSLPDIGPVERRLSALQETVVSLREPDLSGVTSSLRKMEARMNLGSIEDRLNAIEYALSSLTHFVRTRPEPADYSYRPPSYDSRPAPSFTLPVPQSASPPPPPASPPPPPAPEPEAAADPVAAAMRPDDKANLLKEAAFGEEDDLELVNGIGPMLCELLNDIGVYYFWQIAEWGPDEIEWVDNKLEHFKGRIQRDDWVGQAKVLAQRTDVAQRPEASQG